MISCNDIFEKYFNGETNLITPHAYQFDLKTFGDEMLLIEKSIGEGIYNDKLYAVTCLVYDIHSQLVQRIDLCECFYSKEELEDYIESITEEKFDKAIRYGEIKKIKGGWRMTDEISASAILLIADMIYEDYEMMKLTSEEYYRIINIEKIIQKYTTKYVAQVHAMLNSYFDC